MNDLANVLAVVTAAGGVGTALYYISFIKNVGEAVKAVSKFIEAVHAFIKDASEELKQDPEYQAMVKALDLATEELADVFDTFKATKKFAQKLRDIVKG